MSGGPVVPPDGVGHRKTGSGGRPWVTFDSPKPPAVRNPYDYWTDEPPAPSERCLWWLRQIQRGWRPNKHLRREGYSVSAEVYGVWLYEYFHVIASALGEGRKRPRVPYACGHWDPVRGCGGCDPGAVEMQVLDDGTVLREGDPGWHDL